MHSVTPNAFEPGDVWKNGYGSLPQEEAREAMAANFDFFGSNAELLDVVRSGHDDEAVGDTGPCDEGGTSVSEINHMHGTQVHDAYVCDADASALEEQLRRQAIYIAELEDENMNLREVILHISS